MNRKKIRITCINVHTSNHITHTILQNHANPETSDTDIIIITEPWIGTVHADTQDKGTNTHHDWKCYIPTKISEARVAVYIQKSTQIQFNLLFHKPYKHNYILTARISLVQSKSFLLYAMYNSPTTFAASNFLIHNVKISEPAILIGNFNLHSPQWDTTVENEDPWTQEFSSWMVDNVLRVLNDLTTPTFVEHHFQHKKVDDLVLANVDIQHEHEINPIHVELVNHFNSDHYPISCEISILNNKADFYSTDINFSFSKNKKDDWTKEITPVLSNINQSFNPSLSNTDLDSIASKIKDAMIATIQKVMKPTRISSYHSKHWWNEDLSNTINDLHQQVEILKILQNPYLI